MEKINEILANTFNLSSDEVLKNLGMDDVENWDSLTHMNLIVSIEEEFKIEISGDDISEMITFNSIRDILKKYI